MAKHQNSGVSAAGSQGCMRQSSEQQSLRTSWRRVEAAGSGGFQVPMVVLNHLQLLLPVSGSCRRRKYMQRFAKDELFAAGVREGRNRTPTAILYRVWRCSAHCSPKVLYDLSEPLYGLPEVLSGFERLSMSPPADPVPQQIHPGSGGQPRGRQSDCLPSPPHLVNINIVS